ncbi:hypothetical protein [Parvularcula oceani]|uniref:hypothetical protein n=1 Tax=Parvularcula oceani TaxID=1247963 RepID=UPI0004E24550|nr:hypothetical protein [Parvularcula oceani]
MTASFRVQFRLSKARTNALKDLAETAGVSPNLMAKSLCEVALSRQETDPKSVERDLLIIRAGMEQLFRRSGRESELDAAIDALEKHRTATVRTVQRGGLS